MFENIVLVFELIGTVAFSISGAMIARKKRMDIFGILILGLCTAGGGSLFHRENIQSLAMASGALTVFVLRMLAAHYEWSLPKPYILS